MKNNDVWGCWYAPKHENSCMSFVGCVRCIGFLFVYLLFLFHLIVCFLRAFMWLNIFVVFSQKLQICFNIFSHLPLQRQFNQWAIFLQLLLITWEANGEMGRYYKHGKSAKLPWRRNIELSFWSLSFVSFFCLFVLLSRRHSDHISEGSQVSKVTLCVKNLKWHWPTELQRSGIELPGQLKTEASMGQNQSAGIFNLVISGWGRGEL